MKFYLVVMVTLASALAAVCQSDPWKNVYTESAWKERDSWQRADEIIKHLKIQQGSHVADIGSHEGYMTIKLSQVVGKTGKVWAVDVDAYKLEKLRQHAVSRNAMNIETIKGDYDNPHLPANALDAVIILDTYHEMDDHDKILAHIKTALKKNGRLVLCEPIAESRRNAARSAQEARHELGMNFALEDLQKAGFKVRSQIDPFTDRVKIKGDVMWLVVAEKE